jgi:hypothetical protein
VSDPVERLSDTGKLAETSFPISLGELDRNTRAWVKANAGDLERRLTFLRLREERTEDVWRVNQAVLDRGERTILIAVSQEGGSATYDDCMSFVPYGRRQLRNRVERLETDGLLDVAHGRPTIVGWADEGVEVLAEDALARWFDQ